MYHNKNSANSWSNCFTEHNLSTILKCVLSESNSSPIQATASRPRMLVSIKFKEPCNVFSGFSYSLLFSVVSFLVASLRQFHLMFCGSFSLNLFPLFLGPRDTHRRHSCSLVFILHIHGLISAQFTL